MKKIIYVIMLSILIGVGGFMFVGNKYSVAQDINLQKNYVLVKASGASSNYKYPIPFDVGTKLIDIAVNFFDDPKKIYIKKGKSWYEALPFKKIYNDITIKI